MFEPHGDAFVATALARGPWDAGAQHGGAPSALLAHCFEQLPGADGLVTARLTYELLRPVPIDRLTVEARVARPGRRVQVLEGAIFAPDGTEVVRARALRVAPIHPGVALTAGADGPPPGPEHGIADAVRLAPGLLFAGDAVEIRFVAGSFMEPGPATAWFRMKVPVVAGVTVTPLQTAAAAADFGNGISAALPWDRHTFINPDLTVYFERAPVGEWVALASETRIAADGIGVAESVLYDERGRIGRALQSLLIAPR